MKAKEAPWREERSKSDERIRSVVNLNACIGRSAQRAYDMFRHRASWSGGPLIDWLNAKHELVWRPPLGFVRKTINWRYWRRSPASIRRTWTCRSRPKTSSSSRMSTISTPRSLAGCISASSAGVRSFALSNCPQDRSRDRESRVSQRVAASHGVDCQTSHDEDVCTGGMTGV